MRLRRPISPLLVVTLGSLVAWLTAFSERSTLRATAQAPAPQTLPGFTDEIVVSGLDSPTVVAFSPDGRIFVGEKSGIIRVFDGPGDQTGSVFADLTTQVHNYWDRGLLGMALDPGFPTTPYVYVLYARDAAIGGTAPRWGVAGTTSDGCPDPPGGTQDGCVASGRLSRLEAIGNVWSGSEHVLVDDWFLQFPGHGTGALVFGPDGSLYASGGDGASWQYADYGQAGDPPNPGGDPPVPVGGAQTPPSAEGGALRAQDLRTSGDPAGLNGTVIRVDPSTGAALPDNPLFSHADANARRILAYGLRNPFRMVMRPGTRELWVGDVGWRDWEEILRVPDPSAGVVRNFGWPCYDGPSRTAYDAVDLKICEDLYAEPGAVTSAHYQYREGDPIVAGEACEFTDSSLSGLAFYEGGTYPEQYNGALFFADYTRGCIWVMPAGADGVPDPARRGIFVARAAFPVDLKIGPGGDVHYVDIVGGTVRRVRFGSAGTPTAAINADRTSGSAPLTVRFDGSGSRDPQGAPLAYSWDLDGNGTFGDSTVAAPSHTYSSDGTRTVTLRVTDNEGLADTATITITVGARPTAVIDAPASSLRWRVGQQVTFSGHATDPEDGGLPASALRWSLVMNHCSSPTSCHEHAIQEYAGVSSGTFVAPDHEYPSFLTLRLTATDSGGLRSESFLRLDPETVQWSLVTEPAGLQLTLGSETLRAPADRTMIVGSTATIGAPSPQTVSNTSYVFSGWSDGGAQTHRVTAGPTASRYVAAFNASAASLPTGWTSRDIGAVGSAGNATFSGGTFTVRGAGADVWGTADAFHFAYRSLAGDGTIVARVAAISGQQAWTKVGVMIRASTDPGAPHAFMLVSTARGAAFQRRTSPGETTSSTSAAAGITAPQWVRLVRTGATITASISATGGSWTTVGEAVFSMPGSVLVGLAVSSHETALATGTVDGVSVTTPPGPLPAGWQSQDVGSVGTAGSASESAGTFTVNGAGADVWGTADAFHYAYRSLTGDGTIVARVAEIDGQQAWTKVGVMMRASTDPGAQQAFMLVSTGRGAAFQRRTSTGGTSTSTSVASITAPQWVRLVRTGTTITASISSNGTSWTIVGESVFSMPAAILVGLAVSSHETALATGTFDGVSVTTPSIPSGPLPAGWQSQDVGSVGAAGSAAESSGSFTVRGAGADVWGTADAFHYAYRSLTGDGTILARVAAINGQQAWTKVGVMMRASTDPGAQHAFMLVSTAKGAAFQRRTSTGGTSTSTSAGLVTAPQWVRLVRSGATITASISSNATNWTTVGEAVFSMPAAILVGLAVSSHETALATGTFDGVSVTTPSGPLPIGWQAQDVGSVGSAGSAIESGGTFTVKGAGADVWGTADAFHYAYRSLTGDGTIVARVAAVNGQQAWTKVGVMVRASTDASAQHAFMLVSTSKGAAFQRRTSTGGTSASTSAGLVTAPQWVRLVRSGATITASISSNGTTWTTVGSAVFSMPATVLVGLAVCGHEAGLATGTFDSVTVMSLTSDEP